MKMAGKGTASAVSAKTAGLSLRLAFSIVTPAFAGVMYF